MKTQWKLSPLLLVAAALISGCNSEDDSADNGNGDNGTSTGNGGSEGFAELQGTWRSDCHLFTPLEADAESSYQVITRVIDGDQADQTVESYDENDPTCSGTNITANIIWQYTVGESFTTPSGIEARPVDIKVFLDPQNVAEYEEQFDILHIDDDIAYFATYASETAATRPNELDFDVPHRRIED